jgi:hypothetical protein
MDVCLILIGVVNGRSRKRKVAKFLAVRDPGSWLIRERKACVVMKGGLV